MINNQDKNENRVKLSNGSFNSAIFLVLLFVIANLFIKYSSALAFLLSVYIIFQRKDNVNSYRLLFFLMPFAQIFKLTATTMSLFTLIEMVFIVKQIIGKRKIHKKFIMGVFILCSFCLISGLISGNLGLFEIIKLFVNCAIIHCFIDDYSSSEYANYTKTYSMGLIISSILGTISALKPAIYALSGGEQDYIWTTVYVAVNRSSGMFSDTNYYALALIVAIGLNIALIASGNGSKASKIMMGALIVFGVFTYSKSYYLMLVVLAIVAFALLATNGKIGWMAFAVLSLCIVIFSGIAANLDVVQNMLSRFSGTNNLGDITTGRTNIWNSYLSYINGNIRTRLLGDGLGAEYYMGVATHNAYIETYYKIGTIGIVTYLLFLISLMRTRKVLIKRNITNYYLYLCVAVMYFSLAGFNSYEFTFYIIACWMVSNTSLIAANKVSDKRVP